MRIGSLTHSGHPQKVTASSGASPYKERGSPTRGKVAGEGSQPTPERETTVTTHKCVLGRNAASSVNKHPDKIPISGIARTQLNAVRKAHSGSNTETTQKEQKGKAQKAVGRARHYHPSALCVRCHCQESAQLHIYRGQHGIPGDEAEWLGHRNNRGRAQATQHKGWQLAVKQTRTRSFSVSIKFPLLFYYVVLLYFFHGDKERQVERIFYPADPSSMKHRLP